MQCPTIQIEHLCVFMCKMTQQWSRENKAE